MRNKKINRVLFPLVIVIWVVIILKIFPFLQSEQKVSQSGARKVRTNAEIKQPDSVYLLLNYRDPFSCDQLQSSRKVRKQQLGQTWPKIIFYGYVGDCAKRDVLASLKIGDEHVLLRSSDNFRGVKVLKINKEKITLSYEGQIRGYDKDDIK